MPAGFCVTTDAFRRILSAAPGTEERLDRLARLDPGDRERSARSARRFARPSKGPPSRRLASASPDRRLARRASSYAVRSSATAEDLPAASFAGQQDTYLNVTGPAAVLEHVSRCWASLFTDRAVTYRLRNGLES